MLNECRCGEPVVETQARCQACGTPNAAYTGNGRTITLLVLAGLVVATLVMAAVGAHWASIVGLWLIGVGLAARARRGVGGALDEVALQAAREAAIAASDDPDDRPMATEEKVRVVLVATCFAVPFFAWIWFYMFRIRPHINDVVFQYISSYPAAIHAIPIVSLPLGLLWLYQRVFGGRSA